MKLPFTKAENVNKPLKGYGFAFIDSEDNKLKIKKHDSIIEFTNDLSDIQLLDLIDYTAFDVFVTESISKGTSVSEMPDDFKSLIPEEYYSATLDYTANWNMTHQFTIRSLQNINENDVIVDWGDGTYSKLKDATDDNENDVFIKYVYKTNEDDSVSDEIDEYNYVLTHIYPSEFKNKVCKVKIFGKNYFAIMQNTDYTKNLLCGVFGPKNKVASHITNLSSFAIHSYLLFYIDFSNTFSNNKIYNFANMCLNCRNLRSAENYPALTHLYSCSKIFSTCRRLIFTDFILPRSVTDIFGYRDVFYSCLQLAVPIENLFPQQGFLSSSKISFRNVFYQCKLITGTVPAHFLWLNNLLKWEDHATTFYQNSELILNQVPQSWGGSAADSIIEKLDSEKIVELESTIASLIERIATLENV